jgi:hypothetical protein
MLSFEWKNEGYNNHGMSIWEKLLRNLVFINKDRVFEWKFEGTKFMTHEVTL